MAKSKGKNPGGLIVNGLVEVAVAAASGYWVISHRPSFVTQARERVYGMDFPNHWFFNEYIFVLCVLVSLLLTLDGLRGIGRGINQLAPKDQGKSDGSESE